MIISEKQIMKLITIAYTHIANCHIMNEIEAMKEVQILLAQINDQQSEELKVIE